MSLNFLIAPDFSPQQFSGWHLLNTVLQRRSGQRIHLLLPANAAEQARWMAEGRIDLAYASPFDAATLVREAGYVPLARPAHRADEMVIAASAQSSLERVEDLRPGCAIALTEQRDVRLIGLRLIEPADLGERDVHWQQVDSIQAAARLLLQGRVDAAFFSADAFHALARPTRAGLRVLVESALRDISHMLLAHPRAEDKARALMPALLGLGKDLGSRDVLDAVGLPGGFEAVSREDAEFMVDLMDTLLE